MRNYSIDKVLLSCGMAGAAIFVSVFLTEGALRENYNTSMYPVSSLSIGSRGWLQIGNFIVTGSLIIAFSTALKKQFRLTNSGKKVSRLVFLVGAGLLGAGVFSTDPIYGYPRELPLRLSQYTIAGHLHDLCSMVVFICLPWACIVARKEFVQSGKQKLALYSVFSAAFIVVAFVLSAAGFKQAPVLVNVAGLLQRLSIIGGCLWLAMLGIYFLKNRTVHRTTIL